LGHEGAGIVERVGAAVKPVAPATLSYSPINRAALSIVLVGPSRHCDNLFAANSVA